MSDCPHLGEPGSRTPAQAEILAAGLLRTGFHCILQLPTGSGKTWLAEQAIAEVSDGGGRAIYLAPLRALAEELRSRWVERFPGVPVGVFTGEYGPGRQRLPVPLHEARVLVMTPERLDACTRSWRSHWGWIPQVELLVVDEFHLLGDPRRGARLEGTLLRFLRLNPLVRILGLSATLGNRPELADWLRGVEYGDERRAVPLRWRIVRYRQASEKPELLARELSLCLRAGGQSLVFVQSRRRAEELCQQLVTFGLPAAHHHAGLLHLDRSRVEAGFRGGVVRVLVATSTLELGLNLPVRQVVLYDLQQFEGEEYRPLPVASVWQRAGRAGRPGLDQAGEVVLLAPRWDRTVEHYPRGCFEPIRSGLTDPRHLTEQIVVEVGSGLSRTRGQLARALQGSLAAHQGRLPPIEPLVDELIEAGLLDEPRAREPVAPPLLRPTPLGRVATRHLLTPGTIARCRILATSDLGPTLFDLLLWLASTEDCEPVLPVDFEELELLATGLSREPSRLLQTTHAELRARLPGRGKRLLAAFKMALVARTWTRTGDAGAVAVGWHCYPSEVARLGESLTRLLLALGEVLRVTLPEGQPEPPEQWGAPERIRLLQRMLELGLDEDAAALTLIKGLGPRMVVRLRGLGRGTLEQLAGADVAWLGGQPGIGPTRANRWIAAAGDLLRGGVADRLHAASGSPGRLQARWPTGTDPYRLRRALELTVQPEGDEATSFRVSGGLEPHRVQRRGDRLCCDCADAAQGWLCKHVCAVRLHQGDPELHALVGRLGSTADEAPPDLFRLWFDDPAAR